MYRITKYQSVKLTLAGVQNCQLYIRGYQFDIGYSIFAAELLFLINSKNLVLQLSIILLIEYSTDYSID